MGNERIRKFFESEENILRFSETDYGAYRRKSEMLSFAKPNDLEVFLCGHEQCISTKTAVEGPIRFYSLHYVVTGKGYLECAQKKYTVCAGDVFISYAGETATFYPDKDDPSEYIFFSLRGILQDEAVRQMGFSRDCCVVSVGKGNVAKDFYALLENAMQYGELSFKTLGSLYTLVGDMSNASGNEYMLTTQKEKYLRRAIEFIVNNIDNVKVDDIARNCALSEAYLTRICRETTGISLKELVIVYRMHIARNWLRWTKVPISKVGKEIGYADKKYFVHAFREIFGMTPAQFRQSEQDKDK